MCEDCFPEEGEGRQDRCPHRVRCGDIVGGREYQYLQLSTYLQTPCPVTSGRKRPTMLRRSPEDREVCPEVMAAVMAARANGRIESKLGRLPEGSISLELEELRQRCIM